MNTDSKALDRRETAELANLVKMRARLAREDADVRGATMLAEFEAELAREYPANDERWAEIVRRGDDLIKEADAEIGRICDEVGIRPEFRPSLNAYWSSRGENKLKERRAELRKVAETTVKAMVKDAKLTIGREELRARTVLAEQVLTSDQAKGLLEAVPTVEELLPTLALREIEAATPHRPNRW